MVFQKKYYIVGFCLLGSKMSKRGTYGKWNEDSLKIAKPACKKGDYGLMECACIMECQNQLQTDRLIVKMRFLIPLNALVGKPYLVHKWKQFSPTTITCLIKGLWGLRSMMLDSLHSILQKNKNSYTALTKKKK